MNKFEQYLKNLDKHENKKRKNSLNYRGRILVNAGIGLNWIGDSVANPKIRYKEIEMPVEKIQFTGTSPEWNKILINQCNRSVENFRRLIIKNPKIKKKFNKEASFDKRPILIRSSEDTGFYKVVDGMHRFVGATLKGKKKIKAFVPINENKYLPICEAHVIYDLIRGYIRSAQDEKGKTELYYALRLLYRTYANAADSLKNRFNKNYVNNDNVQRIIKKVLRSKYANHSSVKK